VYRPTKLPSVPRNVAWPTRGNNGNLRPQTPGFHAHAGVLQTSGRPAEHRQADDWDRLSGQPAPTTTVAKERLGPRTIGQSAAQALIPLSVLFCIQIFGVSARWEVLDPHGGSVNASFPIFRLYDAVARRTPTVSQQAGRMRQALADATATTPRNRTTLTALWPAAEFAVGPGSRGLGRALQFSTPPPDCGEVFSSFGVHF
jgi:hypothetical protein